ncbi:MAG: hypothetical protein VB144_02985 [Clostridia bacterium]|nr:hypothetical protein [Clostridia bacterium]
MKRLAVILAALMITAFALPVSAAQVSLGGNLKGEVWYDFGKGPGLTTDLDLALNVGLVGGQTVKGVIKLKPIEWTFMSETGKTVASVVNPVGAIAIDTAYLEAVGPYWLGGPVVATRLGDLQIEYSPYILDTKILDGVSVSGMNFGPMAIDGFYAWDAGVPVRGAHAAGRISGVGLDAAIAKIANDEYNYVVSAAATPISNVAIEGIYAGQTTTNSSALRIGGAFGLPYGITATAGYRRTATEFDPKYRLGGEDDPLLGEHGVAAITGAVSTNVRGFGIVVDGEILGADNDGKLDDERSIGASVATNVMGFGLSAKHRITQNLAAETVTNKTGLGIAMAEREVMPAIRMAADYSMTVTNFSIHDVRHVAHASVSSGIPALSGVRLSGLLDTNPAPDANGQPTPGRELKAEYGAPNGVTLGYTYNNIGTNKVFAGMEVSF